MTARDLSRREFLRAMTAAGLATIAGGAPRLSAADPVKHPEPTADTCILLWMAGGMAAPDTFDPKRYQPFEIGVPVVINTHGLTPTLPGFSRAPIFRCASKWYTRRGQARQSLTFSCLRLVRKAAIGPESDGF